jgi:hypothetical protein
LPRRVGVVVVVEVVAGGRKGCSDGKISIHYRRKLHTEMEKFQYITEESYTRRWKNFNTLQKKVTHGDGIISIHYRRKLHTEME